MKHLPFSCLLLASLALVAGGDPATPGKATPPCCRALPATQSYTDRSLYQLESKWTSDLGKEIQLGVLRGRPQIFALFFTHCEFACPIIVQDLKRIEAGLTSSTRGGVDFVLVSLDTDRDSVTVLHQYRQKQHLPGANWVLLRGGAEDVRELAALLGVNYQRDERGQFAHSNLITVLNGEGEIAFQQQGLNQPVTAVVQRLEELIRKPSGQAVPPKPATP